MQAGKLNIVTDGQHGSVAKGAITTYLAWKHRPEILSTTSMANAGHTAVNFDGESFVAKALPSAAILNKWLDDYDPTVFVGSTAAFHLNQLEKERSLCGFIKIHLQQKLLIHPRAGVITQQHIDAENGEGGTKHLASTMQGCGAFLADKVMRRRELKLAKDYIELTLHTLWRQPPHVYLAEKLAEGQTILHEGSQGFSLDISHGSHYPECTSRGTTAMQNIADLGLNHSQLGDVYLAFRPYPIRVGNVYEAGEAVGHSGGCYSDNHEIDWEHVIQQCGGPASIKDKELTTVTKRLRRVFTFSMQQLREAIQCNGATKLVLTFANYVDWSCYQNNDISTWSPKVLDFVKMVEDGTGCKVAMVSNGPRISDVVEL